MLSYVGTDVCRAPYVDIATYIGCNFHQVFNINLFREVRLSGKPHGVAVDIWAVGILALQLLFGNYSFGIEEFEHVSDEEIEDLVVQVNAGRTGQQNGPISQNGVDFIIACLNLRPHKRPTATEASKHAWLRESQQELDLFKERDKRLAWKPRGLVIPAIVELEDVAEDTPEPESAAANQQAPSPRLGEDELDGQPSSLQVPDSVDDSQTSRNVVEEEFKWLQKRSEAMAGFQRPCSMTNFRSASVA